MTTRFENTDGRRDWCINRSDPFLRFHWSWSGHQHGQFANLHFSKCAERTATFFSDMIFFLISLICESESTKDRLLTNRIQCTLLQVNTYLSLSTVGIINTNRGLFCRKFFGTPFRLDSFFWVGNGINNFFHGFRLKSVWNQQQQSVKLKPPHSVLTSRSTEDFDV